MREKAQQSRTIATFLQLHQLQQAIQQQHAPLYQCKPSRTIVKASCQATGITSRPPSSNHLTVVVEAHLSLLHHTSASIVMKGDDNGARVRNAAT
jgi:hypothetical protein